MGSRGDIRYVFTSSNTCQGFHSFLPELIKPLHRVYILKGAPGTGKATFIRLLGESLAERGYEVDFWLSAADPLNPEGLYLSRLDLAVVNGSQGMPLDPHYPGATGDIILLDQYQDREALRQHGREIIHLIDGLEAENARVGKLVRQAAQVKHEIKKVTSKRLVYEKLFQLADQLEEEMFKEGPGERHYYASAFSAEGTINYVDEISQGCHRRYILKGPPGSAKSTVIAEIAHRGRARGWYLEYYHCGLEPDSLVMVIMPSQGIALIDGGSSGYNLRPGDVSIDMNNYLQELDHPELESETTEAWRNYEGRLLEAQSVLESAHKMHMDLKKIYSSAMDFTRLDQRREELLREILEDNE